tara:strand:- start:1546 stop:2811 length:1266 start_codon:yes stop_codon:yes gene_type:complete
VNILGIAGAIGWDGNWSMINDVDYWVHGSGATLFVDGELKNALSEERLTRIKYDGRYPENAIEKILTENNLTNEDVDVVAYVAGAVLLCYSLKLRGYLTTTLKKLFPNARIITVDHHIAHAAASFLTSGFEEANVFTFDGAGDFHPDQQWDAPKLNNTSFYNASRKDKSLTNINNTYINEEGTNSFGGVYSEYSIMIYEMKVNGVIPSEEDVDQVTENYTQIMKKVLNLHSFSDFVDITNYKSNIEDDIYDNPKLRETYPGKIMGLSAYGNHENIDAPDIYELIFEDDFPVIKVDKETKLHIIQNSKDYLPEDLADWLQYNFEKYLLLYLKNIPEEIKTKKLCLGGGCALNILANSKIISEGIYEDVHVNTAPNDDGLSFGAAAWAATRMEEDLVLPLNQGCLGGSYSDEYIKTCLENYKE